MAFISRPAPPSYTCKDPHTRIPGFFFFFLLFQLLSSEAAARLRCAARASSGISGPARLAFQSVTDRLSFKNTISPVYVV